MKQIVITQHGDADVLKIQEKSDPDTIFRRSAHQG